MSTLSACRCHDKCVLASPAHWRATLSGGAALPPYLQFFVESVWFLQSLGPQLKFLFRGAVLAALEAISSHITNLTTASWSRRRREAASILEEIACTSSREILQWSVNSCRVISQEPAENVCIYHQAYHRKISLYW
jgi:hypothetical protein